MTLKSKFKVDFITEYENSGIEASLSAITDPESDFTQTTPLGTLRIRLQGQSRANSELKPGKKYIMTLEEVVE